MIRATAERLRALLAERYGLHLAILEDPKDVAIAEPAIVLSSYSAGDIYSGGTYTEVIRLKNLPRPDIGEPIDVSFSVSEHDLSGQCDGWEARISGANPADESAFRELFAPGEHAGRMGVNRTPTFSFNGVEKPF